MRTAPRSPCLPVAIAFGLGIALDRTWGGAVLPGLGVGALSLAAWRVCRHHQPRLAVFSLLLACAALGVAAHHLAWTSVRRDHVAAVASDTPAPLRIRGTLQDSPVIVPPREDDLSGGSAKLDRTICLIACEAIKSDSKFQSTSGLVRLEVSGHLLGVGAGDVVDVVGRVSVPAGPQNPGGFDFRTYLRAMGVHVIVRCSEPDCVTVVTPGNSPRRVLARIRADAEQLITRNLSAETAPIGVAMLLGTRTSLPEEVRDAFRNSGTMHVLAISGLHVAILAGMILFGCRIVDASRLMTLSAVLAAIFAYAAITDAQPPVVRAVLMITILVGGQFTFRGGSMNHSLALAALGVMALNPTHLFDTGAQLSFLAVAGLAWAPTWQRPAPVSSTVPEPDLLWQGLHALGRTTWAGIEATGAVWLFTLPVTASAFHLISPVGFVINVLLAPLSILVLWFGYLLLIVGLIVPPAAAPFGWLFDKGLWSLNWLVTQAAATPLGHFSVSGPPGWWMAGFYVAIFALIIVPRRGLAARLTIRGLLAWTVFGFGLGLLPTSTAGELRATFLSVGHGVAVLVELPNGRCLAYDAGQLQDAGRAEEIIESALWSRGRTSIDALIISHADVDHFNAVPGLAERGVLKTVLIHPTFLDFQQEPVAATCDQCAAAGVPMRLLWAGDRLKLDDRVTLEVLQPDVTARYSSDNANSLLIRVTYRGRSILLTGDLEGTGLANLLNQPRRPADVLLAPHHGSRGSNTAPLAAWAAPSLVVASSGSPGTEERLRTMYGPSTGVWSTFDRGAVVVTISDAGELGFSAFRDPSKLGN